MKDHGKEPRAIPIETPAEPPKRAPRAFTLEGVEPGSSKRRSVVIEEATEPAPFETPAEPEERAAGSSFFSLSSLFWTALSLLFTLYLADATWSLILSLDQKSPWIGQVALGLIGVVVFGLVVFLIREVLAVLRLRRVTGLREEAAALIGKPEPKAARELVLALRDFYARDATSAAGRAEIDRALDELHDPATLLAIAERAVLKPKDDAARHAIATAAQRVSVVTALSPRALVDVVFVLVQGVALIRTLSSIYGGRASGLGLLRLSTRVVSHLAITGGVAMADSLVSQLLGAGLAARLSAKLGEGVLNGVLTARVGIAALDLCRPLPFVECSPIILSEVVKISLMQEKIAENPAA